MNKPIEQPEAPRDPIPDDDQPVGLSAMDAFLPRADGAPKVVGIGAAGGGVEAVRGFFDAMPNQSGMAFVILLALPSHHAGFVGDALRQVTAMPVCQLDGATRLQPNHIYLADPLGSFEYEDGTLALVKGGRRDAGRPVDGLFRTLATALRGNAIGIVMSGLGGDGAQGIRRIREMGGMTFAQSLQDAEFEDMPRHAIATGDVDIVLPVAELPQKLLELAAVETRGEVAMHVADMQAQRHLVDDATLEKALQDIFAILRARTSHDFRRYKRATILRRLERRMQINGIVEVAAYREFLQQHPEETQPLLEDMLVVSTQFFRDPDAFQALRETVMPALFSRDRNGDEPVRVWTVGVATGEEAYSVAMLLDESSGRSRRQSAFQIFATDIDERAISVARSGLYPEVAVADVEPALVAQYFGREPGAYRVKKRLRERILFALHNVLRDPPFARLDLLCCRNVLNYLNRDAQVAALRAFHFSLREGGFLFLGAGETPDAAPELFTVVDKRNRIYRAAAQPPAEAGARERFASPATRPGTARNGTYAEVHQRLLERLSPPSALINRESEIVHLSDRAGRFLRYAGGEPSHNIISAVRPELQLELRMAIFQALQGNQSVESRTVRIVRDGRPYYVKMIARPAHDAEAGAGFVLVLFDEFEDTMARSGAEEGNGKDPVVMQLERALERSRDELRATIEQYEAFSEELTASNEELQATNEELRAAVDELEVNREELKSVNEELLTVNAELKRKVDDTTAVKDDLQNLMTSNDIGTVFVDCELCIKRTTPRATEVFNILPSDFGRPLFDIKHSLEYPGLEHEVREVLRTLRMTEHEVRGNNGRWYVVRILPYRTTENHIAGVILNFIDVTRRHEAEQEVLTLREGGRDENAPA